MRNDGTTTHRHIERRDGDYSSDGTRPHWQTTHSLDRAPHRTGAWKRADAAIPRVRRIDDARELHLKNAAQ